MNHKKLLLTLTLCLCALLCMVVTASASEVQGHTNHFSCGVADCQNNDHGHTQVTEWTAWNGPAANGNTNITYDSNNTAYIYLADNVTTKYSIIVREGKTLYLCLNGKSITKTSKDGTFGGVIVVKEGGKLVLCDCKPSGNEGSITHSPGIEGRGVRMGGSTYGVDTEFLMYGGKISGNHVGDDGAGVQIQNATFKMYGGEISDNHVEKAGNYGGGGVNVYSGGTFTMYGGKISGNTINGNDGGGVAAFNADFKMYGGTITGNAAGNMGGGVYVGNTSPIILSGGSITGNTCGANANGGGVGTYNCDAILFSGNVQITGNVKGGTITNGTLSGGVANNFYLPSGTYITITDELTGSARIGVTTENTPGVGGVKYVTIVSSGSKESLQKLVTNGVLSYENKNEDGSPIGLFTKSNSYSTSLRACSHDFSQWAYSDTQHWKKCANCDAEDAVNKTDHSGGTATCTERAVCTTCGQQYGDTNHNNHDYSQTRMTPTYKASDATCTTPVTYYYSCVCGAKGTNIFNSTKTNEQAKGHAYVDHAAKDPTCTEDGWAAYKTCERCDYTSKEIKPKLNHVFANTWEHNDDKHWHKCTRDGCTGIDAEAAHEWQPATYTAPKTCVCGATQGEPLTRSYYYYAPSAAEDKKDSPKTADPGVLLYAGLALASLTGLACTAKKRH